MQEYSQNPSAEKDDVTLSKTLKLHLVFTPWEGIAFLTHV